MRYVLHILTLRHPLKVRLNFTTSRTRTIELINERKKYVMFLLIWKN